MLLLYFIGKCTLISNSLNECFWLFHSIPHALFPQIPAQIPHLQAFSCPMRKVKLEANGTAEVEVDFLPFTIGEYQVSVILLNENIGEFLYSIEAKATDPLPSYLPYTPSKNSVRISSAAAAGKSSVINLSIDWPREIYVLVVIKKWEPVNLINDYWPLSWILI